MSILPPHEIFLDELFDHIARDGIDVSSYKLDHLCYRVATLEEYCAMRIVLSNMGILLTEAEIDGRPISTYTLTIPLVYQDRTVRLVELPAPKQSISYKTGWEHAEFVVGEDPRIWMTRYPHLDWDTRALSKSVNSDVSRKYDAMCVKFHEYPLDYVIEYLE